MKNIPERQKDILSIISSLDISPTMYKNAVEKYKAITKFLGTVVLKPTCIRKAPLLLEP